MTSYAAMHVSYFFLNIPFPTVVTTSMHDSLKGLDLYDGFLKTGLQSESIIM